MLMDTSLKEALQNKKLSEMTEIVRKPSARKEFANGFEMERHRRVSDSFG